MEKDTVSIYFVGAAVARLTHAAKARVLKAAGLPAELLTVPQARVTAESFATVWMTAARELDDEFFGLDRRRMKVGSFAMLCHSILHSDNLDRAVKRMLRGFALLLDDVRCDLQLAGEHAVIVIENSIKSAPSRLFADETLLVMMHGVMCWLTGKRIPLDRVEFAHPKPAHAQEYQVMYSEHLRFHADRTALYFDARLLAAPIIQDAISLKDFLRGAPQSVFLKYKNRDSWTARLRRRLRDNIGEADWPVLDDVAREFHVASATLRRRLEAEGTSYQGIKNELRRDAAIHHLCHGPLGIADIASLLGFQEPSAFHRAFKKWSGVQPGEYRLRQTQARAPQRSKAAH